MTPEAIETVISELQRMQQELREMIQQNTLRTTTYLVESKADDTTKISKNS